MFDADGYLEAKRTWQRLVQEEPTTSRSSATPPASTPRAKEPSPPGCCNARKISNPPTRSGRGNWPHWNGAKPGAFPEGRDPTGAARALVHFERAHDLSGPADRVDLLPDLALAALAAGEPDKARVHALAMLEAAPSRRDRGDPLHYGNLVLGHLALDANDLAEARTRLLAAGRTGRLPIERSGAPDMSLAKALLQRGESGTVLEYLELCLDFWPEGKERLLDWIVLVEAGLVPDFRRNLLF